MKLKLAIPVAILGVAAAIGVAVVMWPPHYSKTEQWAVVQKYCYECHNRDDMAGDRAFDKMSADRIAEDAETWEAAIRKVRGGLMPPAGGQRPDSQTVAHWYRGSRARSMQAPPSLRPAVCRCAA